MNNKKAVRHERMDSEIQGQSSSKVGSKGS